MKPEVEIMDSINERIERDGLSSLTEAERFYRAIWFLEGETSNGAFHQFFSNDTGLLAEEALAGLRAVGANQMAKCLDEAIGLFPSRVIPAEYDQRNTILDSMSQQQQARMDEVSDRFSDYPDELPALLDE